MTVESVTNIADLNASNPALDDPKSEGDDHIRNIKTALLTDLPNVTGPITATHTELNIMDGVTVSTADINRLSGGLNTKVIEIGTWDMDVTVNVAVAHGLTRSKIRSVSALIRNDSDSNSVDFQSTDDKNGTTIHTIICDSTNVNLYRSTGGYFDSTGFDTMGDDGNRGWIIIQYTD